MGIGWLGLCYVYIFIIRMFSGGVGGCCTHSKMVANNENISSEQEMELS